MKKHDPYELLRELFCKTFCRCEERPKALISLKVGKVIFTLTGDFRMSFPIDTVLIVATVLAFKDSHGNDAPVDGVPTWETDRPDVVDLAPSTDGMSCEIRPRADFMGLAAPVITQKADANMGSGVEEIVTVGVLDLTAGKAGQSTMSFAVPTP